MTNKNITNKISFKSIIDVLRHNPVTSVSSLKEQFDIDEERAERIIHHLEDMKLLNKVGDSYVVDNLVINRLIETKRGF